MNKVLASIFTILLLVACAQSSEELAENAVVRVNNKTLFLDDVAKLVPEGISKKDSVDITQKYIQKWVTREIIVQKAIFNIGEDDAEINRMVLDYKHTLLVKKYKEMLLEQKAEVDPSQEEIDTYYEQNASNYPLHENIMQGVIIKIPANAPKQDQLKAWLESDADSVFADIDSYCYQHASNYDDFRDNWVAVDIIDKLMPDGIASKRNLLKKNYSEQTDTTYNYFLKVTDYMERGEKSPKAFVQKRIITLLRHKKKLEYFDVFEKDIYNEAIKNETVVYNPKYE